MAARTWESSTPRDDRSALVSRTFAPALPSSRDGYWRRAMNMRTVLSFNPDPSAFLNPSS